jgi:hypothetical protein
LLVPGYLVAPTDGALTARSEPKWGDKYPRPPRTPSVTVSKTKILVAIKIHRPYFVLAKNRVTKVLGIPTELADVANSFSDARYP